MKNITSNFLRTMGFAAAISLSLTIFGCSNMVSGEVFLDGNANGQHDSNEPGIPFAKLTVLHGEDVLAEQYADKDGSFKIPIKRRSGQVCIKTDLSFAKGTLKYLLQSQGEEAPAQVLSISHTKAKATTLTDCTTTGGTTTGGTTSGGTTTGCITKGNTTTGCSTTGGTTTGGTTIGGTTTCSSKSGTLSGCTTTDGTTSGGTATGGTTTGCIRTGGTTTDGVTSGGITTDCVTKDGTTTGGTTTGGTTTGCTTQANENDQSQPVVETTSDTGWVGDKLCLTSKGTSIDAVKIPVKLDVQSEIANLSAEGQSLNCYASQPCEVQLMHPLGCTLDKLYLPTGLTAEDQEGVSYDTALHSVTFENQKGTGTKSQTVASPSITIDGFETRPLLLKVSEDITFGTTERTLSPKADCFGQSLALQAMKIELIKEAKVVINLDLKTLTELHQNDQITVAVSVKNMGNNDISDGQLTFIPPPASSISVPPSSGCHNLGDSIECDLPTIPTGESSNISFTFNLPALDTVDTGKVTQLTCDATFKTPEMDKTTKTDKPITLNVKKI